MPEFQYLIVGGGMTADSAVRGIREADPDGSIGVIGAERHAPYNRPPLSKGLWKGGSVDQIWRGTQDCGAQLILDRRAVKLDPAAREIIDDRGIRYAYERLLLATGGSPRRLPFGGGEIVYFRTLDDYERLRSLPPAGQKIAVIGGGFIGSEIAAAMAITGREVVMLFPGEGICRSVFPAYLSDFLNDYYREHGVQVLAGHEVEGLERRGSRLVLHTSAHTRIEVDAVVAGIGIEPNVDLARSAGITCDNGIVVDAGLRTSQPDVFAAGDVAAFRSPALGKRIRVEHEDNANTMGRMAGLSMAGRTVNYDYLPSFYSDLFDLGYEAVGQLDSTSTIAADWKEPYREGIVYYLRDHRVRGVLLWNVWGQVDAARSLIADPGPFRSDDLKGRLPA